MLFSTLPTMTPITLFSPVYLLIPRYQFNPLSLKLAVMFTPSVHDETILEREPTQNLNYNQKDSSTGIREAVSCCRVFSPPARIPPPNSLFGRGQCTERYVGCYSPLCSLCSIVVVQYSCSVVVVQLLLWLLLVLAAAQRLRISAFANRAIPHLPKMILCAAKLNDYSPHLQLLGSRYSQVGLFNSVVYNVPLYNSLV